MSNQLVPFRKGTDMYAVYRAAVHGDVVLTKQQEQYWQRLITADEQLRNRELRRSEIANLISSRFGVSKWRADSDITDAQQLFATTRKVNKHYILGEHIENIIRQIKAVSDAKKYELLANLNNSLTRAIEALPEETRAANTTPTRLFFINQNFTSKPDDVKQLIEDTENLLDAEFTD